MFLTRAAFLKRLNCNAAVVCLTGMSNVGKSHWSRQFKPLGFHVICCDTEIARKLGSVLDDYGGRSTTSVSDWMGQPGDNGYDRKQRQYLELEELVVELILVKLKARRYRQNVVIDTTGSLAHLPAGLRARLHEAAFTIYLQNSEAGIASMLEDYIFCPKPVAFDTLYDPRLGENRDETLARCYTKLVHFRAARYAEGADAIVCADIVRNFTAADPLLPPASQLLLLALDSQQSIVTV